MSEPPRPCSTHDALLLQKPIAAGSVGVDSTAPWVGLPDARDGKSVLDAAHRIVFTPCAPCSVRWGQLPRSLEPRRGRQIRRRDQPRLFGHVFEAGLPSVPRAHVAVEAQWGAEGLGRDQVGRAVAVKVSPRELARAVTVPFASVDAAHGRRLDRVKGGAVSDVKHVAQRGGLDAGGGASAGNYEVERPVAVGVRKCRAAGRGDVVREGELAVGAVERG